ncbi:MAG: cardiolipin synthase [Bacillota bacterium]|nr:cardiolipin synthase [Bacillota bacterium]
MKRIFLVIMLLVLVMFIYSAAAVQYITFNSLNNIMPSWIVVLAIEILLGLAAIGVTIRIVLKQTYAYHKSHWILIMLLSPVVGIILYAVFARDFRTGSLTRTRPLIASKAFLKLEETTSPDYAAHPSGEIFRYIHAITGRAVYDGDTSVGILSNGDVFFPRLIAELEKAKEYILMEFYIIKTDRIGHQVLDILAKKAREGVDVRLLYDHFGSNKHLNARYMKNLKAAGVHVAVFDPQQISFVDTNVNFRNHRKATIIDGKVGFLGGLNLGDEYNHDSKRFGFWRDTHVMLEGNGVTSIQNVFIKDWYYVTGAVLEKPLDKTVVSFPGLLAIIESGPDFENGLIKEVYLKMINSAKRSIKIATPYLILEPEMMISLKIAAQSGVAIDILVPGKSDYAMVGFATRSYYETLLSYGIRVHEFVDTFVHSKILIVDDDLASVGSVNFDPRSFHLNFEATAVFENAAVNDLVAAFAADLEKAPSIDLEQWKQRGMLKRLLQGLFNLFSPLF